MTDDRRPHIIRGVWPSATPLIRRVGTASFSALSAVLEIHTNDLRVAVNGYEEGYDHE